MNNNIYMAATIGRDIGDVAAGAALFKYDGSGTRIWVKEFGSRMAGDSLNGIAVNHDSSEIIISGTIGAQSTLHTDNTRLDVSAVVILRASAKNGEIIGMAVGELFDSSVGVVGNALTVKIVNGTGKCFVAGTSQVKSPRGSTIHNAAVYSFSYPDLELLAKKQVLSQTEDAFVGVETSINNYSLFAVGIADVSKYSELDGRVVRFNASNLAIGWNKSIETTTFPDQASIETGMVSEAARDVAVDEYGNVYVLIEASGPIGSEEAQETLKNKRPALIVYAPNGTEVHKVQSKATEPTSAQSLLLHNGTALVGGWTLDPMTEMKKVFVAGVALPPEAYRSHGSEYQPAKTTSESDGSADAPGKETSSKVGIIGGAAGGAVVLLVAIAAGIAVAMRSRNRTTQSVA